MNPIIESAALDQTEEALRDFVRAACNIGLSKGQVAVMLHKVADDLVPPIIVPEGMTVQ